MTAPKPWTYYNDGEHCGIVLSMHRDGADTLPPTACQRFRIGSLIVTLAQRGDVLCVSTGDILVKPGEQAFVALSDDMGRGWTNDADEPMVRLAGTFVETTEDLDAIEGGHLAIVKLGGSLFSREAEVEHRARLAEHEDRARTQQNARIADIIAQPVQRVYIDWTDTLAAEQQHADPYERAGASHGEAATSFFGTPFKPEPMSLYDTIAAFPGVRHVLLTHDRASGSGPITAELQVGAAFNVVALQNHLHDRVPMLTLDRLRISVESVSFICDVCKREIPCIGEREAIASVCGQCWLAGRLQAPTEPAPRELMLQPLDEPAAAYWRAIQTARDSIDEADDRLRQAREIRWCGDEPAEHLPDFDSRACCRLLAALRKELPDMPTTFAPLDGGCASCGETGC